MSPRFWLLVLLFSATLATQAAPQRTHEPLHAVFNPNGAQLSNTGGPAQRVVGGQDFSNGDTLKTGPDGYLDVEGTDLSLRLNPGTELLIEQFDPIASRYDTGVAIKLNLKSGSILCNVKKLTSASSFVVSMPQGTAAIRGTSFYLDADGICRVTQGAIVVLYLTDTKRRDSTLAPLMPNAGQSSEPPPAPGQPAVITPIPRDLLRSLERDFDDLKKHRVRKQR